MHGTNFVLRGVCMRERMNAIFQRTVKEGLIFCSATSSLEERNKVEYYEKHNSIKVSKNSLKPLKPLQSFKSHKHVGENPRCPIYSFDSHNLNKF